MVRIEDLERLIDLLTYAVAELEELRREIRHERLESALSALYDAQLLLETVRKEEGGE
ncbi:MAG: hypothetical protein LM580_04720 [Thermofilum sp.]|nr:hypothetical protein [Thermofilum sp.]